MKAVINQLCIYSPKENTGGLGIFIQSQKCLLDIWALLFPWSGEYGINLTVNTKTNA